MLPDSNSAVTWKVSILSLISSFSSHFSRPLRTVQRASSTTGITVTLMFPICFSSIIIININYNIIIHLFIFWDQVIPSNFTISALSAVSCLVLLILQSLWSKLLKFFHIHTRCLVTFAASCASVEIAGDCEVMLSGCRKVNRVSIPACSISRI